MHSTGIINGYLRFAFVLALLFGVASQAYAQSHIYVQNDSAYDLLVEELAVSGDPISKKAFNFGETTVGTGERKKVLTLNRAGKVNWMDPTPRFIEPGKTAMFATHIRIKDHSDVLPVSLKQTLTGTGSSSKMQHTLDGVSPEQPWTLDMDRHEGAWDVGSAGRVTITYRSYTQGNDTHIEYIFSNP